VEPARFPQGVIRPDAVLIAVMTYEPSIWGVAEAYERYIGRWSQTIAAGFVDWLALPDGLSWLDVGCGTGALSRTIVAASAPRLVQGVDRSEGFIELARQRATSAERFSVGDALELRVDDASFDVAASGLVMNFVPDPGRMVSELRRAVRPDGTVALYVWDYADGMELIRYFWDAAVALDPGATDLDEGRCFPVCRPDALERLFREAGLLGVESHSIVAPTVFRDFDDYWEPFLGAQGPAPAYAMSLAEPDREALRERLRATLPASADASIGLSARAFAVRGTR
jgi:SAM-dependent methyltransferase